MTGTAPPERPLATTAHAIRRATATRRIAALPRLGGRWQLIVWLSVAGSAVAAAGIWQATRHIDQTRAAEVDRLDTIADLQSREVAEWRARHLTFGRVLGEQLREAPQLLEAGAGGGRSGLLRAWLETVRGAHAYAAVMLADDQGRVIAAAGTNEGVCDAHRAQIAQVLASRRPYLSDLVRDQAAGRIHLAVLVPLALTSPRPGLPSLLVLQIDPATELFPMLQQWPQPSRTAETLLVRAEGSNVLYLNELRHRSNTALSLHLPLATADLPAAMAARGIQKALRATDYRGQPVLAAMRQVPGSSWFLVAKIDRDEALAGLTMQAISDFAFAGVLLLLTVLGGLFVWTRAERGLFKRELRAQIALAESEAVNRAILEQAAVGIARVGLDGRWLQVNDRLCEITGRSREELLAISFQDMTHQDDLDADLEAIRRLVAGEMRSYCREKRYLARDGSPLWVCVTTSLVRSPQGEPQFFVCIVEDIGARKRAEAELAAYQQHLEAMVEARTTALRDANRELEAFAYSVTHDLRSPLRAIAGFSRILVEEQWHRLDAEGRRLLQIVCDNTARMDQLISDLLAFSRVRGTALNAEPIDMQELFREVVRDTLLTADGRNVHIEVGSLPVAYGDRSMMRLVAANLLSNAVKFTRPRPSAQIVVSGFTQGAEVLYCVRDNGVGFDMAFQGKLFGVFQRLHSATEFEGNGIGLAVVDRIVRRHGGRVWAEGAVGEGAAFWFALPRAGEPNQESGS